MKRLSRKYKIVFLEGSRLFLRPLEEGDINRRYLSWLNDREVTRYMDAGAFPTVLEDLRAFYRKMRNSNTGVLLAIVEKKNNKFIGTIKLGNISWVHRYAEMAIMIGDKRYWGRGYAQEAGKLMLEYAFLKLNLNKVFLGVYVNHKAAVRTYKRLSFQIEGRLKKIGNFDGKYVDCLYMGMLRSEFEMSRKKYYVSN